jgi:Arc/MetJ-type ribon-helix-helix transcriptional regulator
MATVKINSELLKKIEKLIKQGNKKLKYSSAKQFVDIAVFELLERERKGRKT